MDILFVDNRLRKLLNLEKRLRRRMSAKNRKMIENRMTELRASDTLEDMRHFPSAHCEELRHFADDHFFSVRIEYPQRIIFEPANDPIPLHPGGNVDWSRVTKIRILEVADYHDR